jgi:hypothetical protein
MGWKNKGHYLLWRRISGKFLRSILKNYWKPKEYTEKAEQKLNGLS